MKNFKFKFKEFNIKNTLIALACTLVFAQTNAMEENPNLNNKFLNLPTEIHLQILQNLENRDIQATACTSRRLNELAKDREIQSLMLLRKIRSDINKLISNIRQPGLSPVTYVNQLNIILKDIEKIDNIRERYNNPEFAKEEKEYLENLLNHDYVKPYKELIESINSNINRDYLINKLSGAIIHAIEIDAHHALSFYIAEYINQTNQEAYNSYLHPIHLIQVAINNEKPRMLEILLQILKPDLNIPLYGNNTILHSAIGQLFYKSSDMEAKAFDLMQIIEILLQHGAKTLSELQQEQQHEKRDLDEVSGEKETQDREKKQR